MVTARVEFSDFGLVSWGVQTRVQINVNPEHETLNPETNLAVCRFMVERFRPKDN